MNLFVLDASPEAAARAHCNKHVVKMIVETAQVLSTVVHLKGETVEGIYRATHQAHPCTLWASERWANFRWAVKLGLALCAEYTERYGKRHKTQDLLEALEAWSRRGGSDTRIAFQFVGPDDCRVRLGDTEFLDVVESYRKLYRLKDRKMSMVWPADRRPEWMDEP